MSWRPEGLRYILMAIRVRHWRAQSCANAGGMHLRALRQAQGQALLCLGKLITSSQACLPAGRFFAPYCAGSRVVFR